MIEKINDLEPGKRIRVEGYKERLSKLATWQKGPPHPNSEGSIEGIKVAECQGQGKIRPRPFPSPHFCPPVPHLGPLVHLSQPPASSPGCCCSFPGMSADVSALCH